MSSSQPVFVHISRTEMLGLTFTPKGEVRIKTTFPDFLVLDERVLAVQCAEFGPCVRGNTCPRNGQCTMTCEPISLRVDPDNETQQIFKLRALSAQ
jgi:hypothetical protein